MSRQYRGYGTIPYRGHVSFPGGINLNLIDDWSDPRDGVLIPAAYPRRGAAPIWKGFFPVETGPDYQKLQ